MDSSIVRLASLIALSTWAIAQIPMLLSSRGKLEMAMGTRWAIGGLCCFAAWMFLSSLSVATTAVIPRADLVTVFAALELGTAVGAWGWLASNVRKKFRIITK